MEEKDIVVDDRIDEFQEEIELPSNGFLGGPTKVVIRAMTTAEEKILYSARDYSFIKKICRACTVSPKLDTNKITPNDLSYMLYQIRKITFGPTYLQPIKCPHCGARQDAVIDIAKFDYTLLDKDSIENKLFIELPISKAKVHLKLLSQDEIDSVEDKAQRLYNENKIQDLDGYVFIQKLCAMIDYIEGVEFEKDSDKVAYVNKMHAADTNAIRNSLNSIDYGLKTNIEVVCENKDCEREIEVLGTVCPEFFRPSK